MKEEKYFPRTQTFSLFCIGLAFLAVSGRAPLKSNSSFFFFFFMSSFVWNGSSWVLLKNNFLHSFFLSSDCHVELNTKLIVNWVFLWDELCNMSAFTWTVLEHVFFCFISKLLFNSYMDHLKTHINWKRMEGRRSASVTVPVCCLYDA